MNRLRVGLALCVSTLGLAATAFGQSRWVEIHPRGTPSIKLDTTTIERREEKAVFRVWTVIAYGSPQHGKGYDGNPIVYWSMKDRTDINCEARRQSLVATYWYSKSGETVWSYTGPRHEYLETVPETVGEAKIIGVCDFLRSTGRFKYFDIQ